MPSKLYTLKEAADLVKRSPTTLRLRVWKKHMKAAKRIGKNILVSETELKKHYPEAFNQ